MTNGVNLPADVLLVHDRNNISGHQIFTIKRRLRWLVCAAVAEEVGSEDAEALFHEEVDLVAPAICVGWKTMEEDKGRFPGLCWAEEICVVDTAGCNGVLVGGWVHDEI